MAPDETTQIDEMLACFGGTPGDLIPMLQAVQGRLGYLSEPALEVVASRTGLPAATVYGVATFYAQFRLEPVGEHVVRVCRGTACHVRGADRILHDLETGLHVRAGHTSEDGRFTLECVACFGSCALAPVVVVDDHVHGRMTSARARKTVGDTGDPEQPAGARPHQVSP